MRREPPALMQSENPGTFRAILVMVLPLILLLRLVRNSTL
jgi:hypothetical protein